MTRIKAENAPTVVYTPLHGTGRAYVQAILREIGLQNVFTVKEQEHPDGNFSTCVSPNPEEKAAMALALRDAEILHPDLVMATDPDADRIGIAVPNQKGAYVLLNGNETGTILFYYLLCKRRELGIPTDGSTVIKTIVTTDMIGAMAETYGVRVREVLTGFKYIGEALEETEDYLLGLEESYGYLVGTHARDKDAISAAMMLSEACAYFKERGKRIYDVLEELYEAFGFYQTDLCSIAMKGKRGMEHMQETLSRLRREPPKDFGGQALSFDDFSNGLYGLPPSDVLRFRSEDFRMIIRPSGTEPKMKIYLQARGRTRTEAEHRLAEMRRMLTVLIPQ